MSEEDFNKTSNLESEYTYHKKVNDQSMGEVTLLKNKNNDGLVICCKEVVKNSKDKFLQVTHEARDRLKLNMKYLIQMKDYSTKEKNDFCSTFYTLKTFWEYQPNHLKKDILDRKSKGQDYSTVELTHLFYNIVEAATYIYEKSHSHGDIRPSSIAVLEEGKSYKLVDRADPSITPLQAQLNHIYSGKENYVSPQIYQALKKGNLNINPDKNKSDVYSLALCILEAGLKKSISTIYDETSVNEKEIEKLLNEFNNKYPENILLITSLKSMLLTDESARPSFKDILARIPSYNEIIEYFSGQEQYYSNDGTEDFTSNTYDNYQPDSHYARNEQEGKFGGQNPDPYAQSQPKRSPPQTNNYSQDQEIDQYAYKQPKSIAKGAPPPQNNNYYDNDQYNGGYDDHHPQTGYDNQNQYNQEQPQFTDDQQYQNDHYHDEDYDQPIAKNAYPPTPQRYQAPAPSRSQNPQPAYTQPPQTQPQYAQPNPKPQTPAPYGSSRQSEQYQPPNYTPLPPTKPPAPQIPASYPRSVPNHPQYSPQENTNPSYSYPKTTVQPPPPTSYYQPANSYSQTTPSGPSYGNYPASTVTTNRPTAAYQPSNYTNSIGSTSTADGEIRFIDGKRYKEIRETISTVNEHGQPVKKTMIKLQPLDGVSGNGAISHTSSVSSNPPSGYYQPSYRA